MKPQKVTVSCPQCGHSQDEPASTYSSVCRKCGQHFRVEDLRRAASTKAKTEEPGKPRPVPPVSVATPKPALPAPEPRRGMKRIECFQCGTELEVSPSAQSTMCKRCSAHVDLQDYDIANTLSKNLRTKGRVVLHETGCLLNTDSIAGEAILKGKLLGKLSADSLEIHRTAQIKGSFKTRKLILPADSVLFWPESLLVRDADISGELTANLRATGTVRLRATAVYFGDIEAKHLVVEEGAVIVGEMKLGDACEVEEPKPNVVIGSSVTAGAPKPVAQQALPFR